MTTKVAVGAPTFDELAPLIRNIVAVNPSYIDWHAIQERDDWWVATCVPSEKPVSKPVPPRAALPLPAPPKAGDNRTEALERRVQALERRLGEVNARLAEMADHNAPAERDYKEFMDGVGWTARMELVS